MFGKVRGEKSFYDTFVFACYYDNISNSKCIVFDEKYETLVSVGLRVPRRNLWEYDYSRKDWTKNGKWEGLDFIIYDKQLLSDIEKGKNVSREVIEKCLKFQEKVKVFDIYEIKTEKDIETILDLTCGFHDGYIKSIKKYKDKTLVVIDTTWDLIIHFELKCAEFSPLFKVGYGGYGEIFDSSMFFENGKIYWTNDITNSAKDICDDRIYFSATEAKWRPEYV